MKKILMVSETFGAGVFAYLSQLCNDMCGHFDVYLAVSLKRPETPKNYRDYLDERVHVIELEHMSTRSITDIGADIRAVRELRAIERKIRPDVIHLHSSIAGGLGRIAFARRKNVVYTPHGYAHILMGSGLKSCVYGTMEHILGRMTRALTLTCCESEDEVARTLTNRSAYIETGLNVKALSPLIDGVFAAKKGAFTVFTLGRITRQKQPHLFNRIAQLVPEAKFVWIGDGELRSCLNAPNIEVTGFKPRLEALALAKNADVFILCSLGEAIAMSLLEGMFMGKLVLVSDVMGNKSVIRSGVNGYVCAAAEDYAQRIREAMAEFPAAVAQRAREDVLRVYNTETMKRKFIDFYDRF